MNSKFSHKKTGYISPKDYFKNFEENLFDKLNLEENTHNILPIENGFNIPEEYLTNFDNKIIKRITQRETKVIPLLNTKVTLFLQNKFKLRN